MRLGGARLETGGAGGGESLCVLRGELLLNMEYVKGDTNFYGECSKESEEVREAVLLNARNQYHVTRLVRKGEGMSRYKPRGLRQYAGAIHVRCGDAFHRLHQARERSVQESAPLMHQVFGPVSCFAMLV